MINTWIIPEHWTWLTLNDVAKWGSGGTPKSSQAEYYGGDIPWLIIADLNDNVVTKSAKSITELGLNNSSAKIVRKGAILVAMYGSIGKLGIAGFECTTNQAIAFTKSIREEVEKRYLFYYLLRIRQNLLDIGKGGTQANISQTVLKQVEFPLAPLNEQRRIVAKLEKILAKVNTCQQRLERIPTILKRFRQSVLAAACSGRLTADWREQNCDVEPAEELLTNFKKTKDYKKVKIKNELTIPFDLPLSWEWINLIEGCKSITDGDHQAPPKQERGIPFLVISNIKDGKLYFSNTRYVSKEYYDKIKESRKPIKGDILYSVVGSYGIPVMVNVEREFCFQRHIALLRVNKLLSNTYLLYILQSLLVFSQATAVATGIAQLTVTLTGLRKIKIPLPPLEEQKEIVTRVEALFKKCDSIEKRYQKAKNYTNKLTQSILAKAFRGELVPQDPNDEPAEILLEKIRSEKAQQEKQTKSKKKTKRKTTTTKKQSKTKPRQLEIPDLN